MKQILVSGLVNLETTLRVDQFPISYQPVRYPFYGVQTSVSGVGFNIAKALHILGDKVVLVSLVGNDFPGQFVNSTLQKLGLTTCAIQFFLHQTPQSVILFDRNGRRQINVDLKNIQDIAYPPQEFKLHLSHTEEFVILCNINFSRPFLNIARQQGLQIATDVHAISNFDDDYNRDFMQAADILFLSHENLSHPPEHFAEILMDRYQNEIIVIGLGSQGALIRVRDDHTSKITRAVAPRPIVNTIGAGDALFSSFIHDYLKSRDPYQALHRAVVFAGYKIGADGAANGFLSEKALDDLMESLKL